MTITTYRGARPRAWEALRGRRLATRVPVTDDSAALAPAALPGLALLLGAEVRVDVQAWSGSRSVTQAAAWTRERTAALARRRRNACYAGDGQAADGRSSRSTAATDPPGGSGAEQEPVVELSLSSGGPVAEVLRALPRLDPAPGAVDPTPVSIPWRESAAVVGALRSGREDVAAHLAGLYDRYGPPAADEGWRP